MIAKPEAEEDSENDCVPDDAICNTVCAEEVAGFATANACHADSDTAGNESVSLMPSNDSAGREPMVAIAG